MRYANLLTINNSKAHYSSLELVVNLRCEIKDTRKVKLDRSNMLYLLIT